MPKKSASAIATEALLPRRTARLAPPPTMSVAEAGIWRETVGAMPLTWFTAEHMQLLTRYCIHCVRAATLEGYVGSFRQCKLLRLTISHLIGMSSSDRIRNHTADPLWSSAPDLARQNQSRVRSVPG